MINIFYTPKNFLTSFQLPLTNGLSHWPSPHTSANPVWPDLGVIQYNTSKLFLSHIEKESYNGPFAGQLFLKNTYDVSLLNLVDLASCLTFAPNTLVLFFNELSLQNQSNQPASI